MSAPTPSPGGAHTRLPWLFRRNENLLTLALLQKRTPEAHEGYSRTNDGGWIITAGDGEDRKQVAIVSFQGKAKRGEAYRTTDPEGQANAVLLVESVNHHAALTARVAELEGALGLTAYSLRAALHAIETTDTDERYKAREEHRLAQVHTSLIKQTHEALANANKLLPEGQQA